MLNMLAAFQNADPDTKVMIQSGGGIFDVVADVERVIDTGEQLFEEMAAVTDSATDPGDGERAAPGAAGRHIGAERHRGTIEDIRPSTEEIGEQGVLELFDKDHIGVGLDADIAGVACRDSARRRRWRGWANCHGHTRDRLIACRIPGHGGEGMAALGCGGGVSKKRGGGPRVFWGSGERQVLNPLTASYSMPSF